MRLQVNIQIQVMAFEMKNMDEALCRFEAALSVSPFDLKAAEHALGDYVSACDFACVVAPEDLKAKIRSNQNKMRRTFKRAQLAVKYGVIS